MRFRRWFPFFQRSALNAVAGWWGTPLPLRLRLLRVQGMKVHRTAVVFPGHRGLGTGVSVGRDCFLGVGFNRMDDGGLTLGEQVRIGAECLVITATHEIGPPERREGPLLLLPVTIGSGTWIGSRVTILPGVTIGPGCVIAAGSVVSSDCAANGLYAGVPARRKRDL